MMFAFAFILFKPVVSFAEKDIGIEKTYNYQPINADLQANDVQLSDLGDRSIFVDIDMGKVIAVDSSTTTLSTSLIENRWKICYVNEVFSSMHNINTDKISQRLNKAIRGDLREQIDKQ
ncbi:MAG: hypothetical protein IT245_03200 [Bacteroidia bacterium]|nr:hypothetical protein [Bacteroidia bacterium]